MELLEVWHLDTHLSTFSYHFSEVLPFWYFSFVSAAKENCKQELWRWQTLPTLKVNSVDRGLHGINDEVTPTSL